MEKTKKLGVIIVFALIIFGLAIAQVLLPDGLLSQTERRKLAQFPELTAKDVFSSEYSTKLEKYFLDQFPLRNGFRTLKAVVSTDLLQLSDNNDIYREGNSIYKMEYPLKEDQVKLAVNKINAIVEAFPEIGNAYYSIIPDKNYFVSKDSSRPAMDYDKLFELMKSGVTNADYIDITSSLSSDDYYRTDTHWRQEALGSVVQRLCEGMGVPAAPISDYKANTLGAFNGVFVGQSALPVPPDEIVYLTNAATENAVVNSVEHDEPLAVYTLEDFEGMDAYDIFLSGAEAVVTIENPNAKTDKELVIFRDSFGSSITPLLIDSYAKITLLDLRYMRTEFIGEYANMEDADVLFLYSTMLINSAGLLK